MPIDPVPYAQQNYQVRFEWGVEGLARLAPTDIVVVVGVLGVSARALSGEPVDRDLADIARAARGARVVVGGIRNAAAVAAHVLDVQRARAARTSVSIIATGDPDASPARFCVEDLLGAGAVAAALGDLGIDHASPDAAVAAEGYRALRGAVRHLLSASGTGRALAAAGRAEVVAAAAERDATDVVPVVTADGISAASRQPDARRG